jgi:hypothetical protein
MEPAKLRGDLLSTLPWWVWLLIFSIPVGPWWLGMIFTAVFFLFLMVISFRVKPNLDSKPR